jgi:putative Holliday junction resolvase
VTGRIIGVDFGEARTGLAVSDLTGMLASGAGVIKGGGIDKTAAAVAEKARTLGAVLIVVGDPVNMNGTRGPRCERVAAFAQKLRELSGLPVELLDERLSTANAYAIMNESNMRSSKRRGVIDELSAELILQSWLDRNRQTQ